MHRYLTALLFSAALLAPLAVTARAEKHIVVRRYYDRGGRDWHQWNDAEELAYRRHLAERRFEYRAYPRVSRERQSEYWRWRHQHP